MESSIGIINDDTPSNLENPSFKQIHIIDAENDLLMSQNHIQTPPKPYWELPYGIQCMLPDRAIDSKGNDQDFQRQKVLHLYKLGPQKECAGGGIFESPFFG